MEILHRPFNIATKPNSWCHIYFCFGWGENQSHLCSYSVSVLLSDITKLTSRRDTVISRVLTAIPPSPRRCRVLRPAFSTRNNCRTGTLWVTCFPAHTNAYQDEEDTRRRHSQKQWWRWCWRRRLRWWRRSASAHRLRKRSQWSNKTPEWGREDGSENMRDVILPHL